MVPLPRLTETHGHYPEPDDAQDIPDATRDYDADAKAAKEAKAFGKAPTNKMVKNAPKTK